MDARQPVEAFFRCACGPTRVSYLQPVRCVACYGVIVKEERHAVGVGVAQLEGFTVQEGADGYACDLAHIEGISPARKK